MLFYSNAKPKSYDAEYISIGCVLNSEHINSLRVYSTETSDLIDW